MKRNANNQIWAVTHTTSPGLTLKLANYLFIKDTLEYLEDKGVEHTIDPAVATYNPGMTCTRIESFYVVPFNKKMMEEVVNPELRNIAKKLRFKLRIDRRDEKYLVVYSYRGDWDDYEKAKGTIR